MRRRLDLAAALMTRPPVLFLDEPTTGLDPTSRQRVWEAIRELLGEGVTVLLTTQYLEEADALAHRIVVVDHGKVIANGTPRELKEASRSAHLEVTLATPDPDARERRIAPLVTGQVHVSEDGRRLAPAWTPRRAWPPRSCGRSTRRESWWTTSRCASPRSTTCSSPSPAGTSRRTRDEDGATSCRTARRRRQRVRHVATARATTANELEGVRT